MEIEFGNGAVKAKNSRNEPRCLDIYTHATGRKVHVDAFYTPARDKHHEKGEKNATIFFELTVRELEHEAPYSERQAFRKRATEQVTFLDIEAARALRDALSKVIAEADDAKFYATEQGKAFAAEEAARL